MDSSSTTFSSITWNIEGLSRNIWNLQNFTNNHFPDFIFLSEPQIFACDLDLAMKPLQGEYKCSLNSADKYDPELPHVKSKAIGGTLAMWKIQHDPYVTIHPVSSTAFLPIIFHPPCSPLTIHVGVYLPTLGKESDFYDELSKLSQCIDELADIHDDAPVYLRGDFNVSNKNLKRSDMLNHFCSEHRLSQVPIPHPTYHHFVGNGLSDSHLDKLLFSRSLIFPEVLETLHCKLSNPLVDSQHDIIVSSW